MKTICLLVLSALSLTNVGLAATKRIPRAEFLETMRGVFPQGFCREDQYFGKCFDLKKAECLEEVHKDLEVCSNSFRPTMPLELEHPVEGPKWSVKIGECVGAEFVKSKIGKKKSTDKCKSIDAWNKK
jgi:hypothetical protein